MKSESAEGMRIASEEEVFDDMSPEDLARRDSEKGGIPDEERGITADRETEHGQAPAAAPNDPVSVTPSSPPLAPPPASHQVEGR